MTPRIQFVSCLLYGLIAVYAVISGNTIVRPNILFFYKFGAVIFSRVDGS